MTDIPKKGSLDFKAGLILTGLCLSWGLNAVAIKVSNQGIAPLFCAGFRSVVATGCLMIWMACKGIGLFPDRLKDGIFIGFLFGAEFGFLYMAVLYTTASSAWILLYTSPFFHALGAHFFLAGDRLSVNKTGGLVLSFAGILLLLSKHLGLPSIREFAGDLLAICAALLWAISTIYIKRRLVASISPYHTLFYQILFSIPILLLFSFLFKEEPIQKINLLIILSVAYQSIIIAVVSYLLWFFLVHSYPVSRLASFTFLTPVFATFAGIILLKEPISFQIIFSLILVSLGIYIVNRE
jgi:drug/metabolite transporter (DMT)-like permease